MDGFLVALAVSFGVIFTAELGDKSQLMALTFATRYRPLPVLVGITLATSVVHAVSVAVGYGLGVALPTGWISLVAAVAFLAFGVWTLRGDALSARERNRAARSGGSAVAAASGAFFLAELGDKTMLATITLATQYGWFGTWLGSTLGMVLADALAIAAGRRLGRHLPERVVAVGAAGLFFVFGLWLALDAVSGFFGVQPWTAAAGYLDHHVAGWIALALGSLAVALVWLGRDRVPRELSGPGPYRAPRRPTGGAHRWVLALFGLSLMLGLAGPLLVAADLVQPIPLLSHPGLVVVGAGVLLLGMTLLLAAQAGVRASRLVAGRPTARRALVTGGVHARVRNPGLTGAVVAMAGTLLMVPTALTLLATVLLVAAVQVQARAVREPSLVSRHGADYQDYAERAGRFLPRIGQH